MELVTDSYDNNNLLRPQLRQSFAQKMICEAEMAIFPVSSRVDFRLFFCSLIPKKSANRLHGEVRRMVTQGTYLQGEITRIDTFLTEVTQQGSVVLFAFFPGPGLFHGIQAIRTDGEFNHFDCLILNDDNVRS